MNFKIKKSESLFGGAGILVAGSIFLLDRAMPLGVADGVLYVVLVLMGLLAKSKRLIYLGAILGTLLTTAGYFLSPPGGELWKVLINRTLAIFTIWMTAVLCLLQNRSGDKLRAAHDELEDRVRQRTAQYNEANTNLAHESAYVQLHKDIAVAANETRALKDTLKICLQRICAHAGWPVGHVYLPADRTSNLLEPTKIWYLEDPERFDTFRKISEATPRTRGWACPDASLP